MYNVYTSANKLLTSLSKYLGVLGVRQVGPAYGIAMKYIVGETRNILLSFRLQVAFSCPCHCGFLFPKWKELFFHFIAPSRDQAKYHDGER